MPKYYLFEENHSPTPTQSSKLFSSSPSSSCCSLLSHTSTASSKNGSASSFTSEISPTSPPQQSYQMSPIVTMGDILKGYKRLSSTPDSSTQQATTASKSSVIGKALLSSATTFMAPSGVSSSIPVHTSNDLRTAIRDELESSLIHMVGHSKAKRLMKNHVEQSHFLLINVDDDPDKAMGERIRSLIENYPTPLRVTGRWNVPLGAQRLSVWQRLIESATTVLVILSRALCRDGILTLCFPEALIRKQAIIPLFLEPFSDEEVESEIPSQLRPIVLNYGKNLYGDGCNLENYVGTLHKHFDHKRHYEQEIQSLESLLDKYKNNPNYVCKCGNC